jgi:TolA-binding protein
MTGRDRECRRAREDVLRRDRLDAVRRGRLALHLKRCDTCRAASEELERIESAKAGLAPLPDERAREIYDGLVPSVHQIAVDLAPPLFRPRRYPLSYALGFGLSAVAAVALLAIVSYRAVSSAGGDAGPALATAAASSVAPAARSMALRGIVDRSEGTVRIDGAPIAEDGAFAVRRGTAIDLLDGARLSFRVVDAASVAIVGSAVWRLDSVTETAIEATLERGKIAVEFDGTRGRGLDIRTPDSLVRVRGTLFTVEVTPGGGTAVSVLEGRVEVVPLRGVSPVVEVGAGEAVSIPGDGRTHPMDGAQKVLASEVDALEDSFVTADGRLVRFAGSPERVMVEVEGRVLGYTPLAVRLPEGPISYRLSAPGMEPVAAKLEGAQERREGVRFDLAPTSDYRAKITANAGRRSVSRRDRASDKSAGTEGRWGLVDRARAAMIAGDMPFAIQLLERAVQELKGDRLVTASSMLAECYSADGQYKKAADAFDRVAALVPDTKVAQNSRYEIGRLSMERLGEYGRARAAFTAYVASPLGGELKEAAYYSLCEIDGREGAHRDALYCFNSFLRAFPEGFYAPNARLWRGALYQDVLRRFADAELDLLAFIQAKPQHPRVDEARYRVALGRYQSGDLKGALRMIDEYRRENPGGQYALRVERLRRAILDPDFSLDLESK